MDAEDLRAYAVEHALDIESLSIYEMAEQCLGEEITDEDAETVHTLIGKAVVTVAFPA